LEPVPRFDAVQHHDRAVEEKPVERHPHPVERQRQGLGPAAGWKPAGEPEAILVAPSLGEGVEVQREDDLIGAEIDHPFAQEVVGVEAEARPRDAHELDGGLTGLAGGEGLPQANGDRGIGTLRVPRQRVAQEEDAMLQPGRLLDRVEALLQPRHHVQRGRDVGELAALQREQ
jgi:hypothetical protein